MCNNSCVGINPCALTGSRFDRISCAVKDSDAEGARKRPASGGAGGLVGEDGPPKGSLNLGGEIKGLGESMVPPQRLQ